MMVLIADDLTGALDSAAPFGEQGMRVHVAFGIDGIPAAFAARPDVIAINSDSRLMDERSAAGRMIGVWRQLAPYAPAMIFKKIDSRLLGHVQVETTMLMEASGRAVAYICPAVPDMGRIVANGRILGEGVDSPIRLADHVRCDDYRLADAADDAALDRLADRILADPARNMAVGARGLARAFARRLGRNHQTIDHVHVPQGPIVMAVGSRDPVSRAQMRRLLHDHPHVVEVTAPAGRIAAPYRPEADVILYRVTDDGEDMAPARVAARFARNLAPILRDSPLHTLFASGGATAAAIAEELGIHSARLVGEVAPAMPAVAIAEWNGMMFITKSGSFGPVDTLSRLVANVVAHAPDAMLPPVGLRA